LDAIGTYREKIQFIQLMGIDNVGFQHQAFDEKVLGKIKEVRIKFPGLPISIDGGVSLETAPELIAAGADRLVVGSAIFNAENPIEAIHNLKSL
jgi:ribulose-phosphate 3-epimerase